MTYHPHLYHQLRQYLSQYSNYRDQRHLTTLSWMSVGVLLSQSLSLTEWEPYVQSRATQAQSYQKRWSRFLRNSKVDTEKLYIPLVIAAIQKWSNTRIYLALDTTVLWNQYCMIHLSLICGGRAIPCLWEVIEHQSASVAFEVYEPVLRKASWLLRHHDDVMLLADRGFAHQALLQWLESRAWHWAVRVPHDTLVHGVHRWRTCTVAQLRKVRGEAKLYHGVRLWEQGTQQVNLVVAHPQGAAEAWAVISNESASLNTLWQSRGAIRQPKAVGLPKAIGLRFRVEELFLDSKSGVFGLADSRLRDTQQLSRLYLVVAVAILYGTVMGTTVQLSGLRRQVDTHWQRGLSYLKIGLRWLRGTVHKGRKLLSLLPLPPRNLQPCFASRRAEADYYERLLFSRVRSLRCST